MARNIDIVCADDPASIAAERLKDPRVIGFGIVALLLLLLFRRRR